MPGLPESMLWADVLRLLVFDARNYWRCQQGQSLHADGYYLEQAFDDLVRCGPMIRHCCSFLDLDADWISEEFIRWCEQAG